MNILTKIRNLLNDIDDTKLSKELKLSFIQDGLDFYDFKILKSKREKIENINETAQAPSIFNLPDDYISLERLEIDYSFRYSFARRIPKNQLFLDDDFIINEFENKIEFVNDLFYSTLYLIYNSASIWTKTRVIENVAAGSSVIVRLEKIEGIRKGDSIIFERNDGEEEIEVKEVDIDNKTITVNLINDLVINDGVLGDIQVLAADKNIVLFSATGNAQITADSLSGKETLSIGEKVSTSWTQGKITQKEDRSLSGSGDGGNSLNSFLQQADTLIAVHPKNLEKQNTMEFNTITLN